MKRFAVAKTMAFVTVALTAAVLPTAAQAAPTALNDCPGGRICAWADDNYSGGRAEWEGNDYNWGDDGMHDNAESLYNNGFSAPRDRVLVYEDVNMGGSYICLERGESVDVWMDDNDYDSHEWVPGC